MTEITPTVHDSPQPSELDRQAFELARASVGVSLPEPSPTLLLISQTSRILGVLGTLYCVFAGTMSLSMGRFFPFGGVSLLAIAIYSVAALSIARGLREQNKRAWYAALLACLAPLAFVNFAVFNQSFLASMGLFGAFLLSLVKDEVE